MPSHATTRWGCIVVERSACEMRLAWWAHSLRLVSGQGGRLWHPGDFGERALGVRAKGHERLVAFRSDSRGAQAFHG